MACESSYLTWAIADKVLEENIITNQIPGVKSIKVKYEGEL